MVVVITRRLLDWQLSPAAFWMVAVISCSLLDGCCYFLETCGWWRVAIFSCGFLNGSYNCLEASRWWLLLPRSLGIVAIFFMEAFGWLLIFRVAFWMVPIFS